MPAPAVAIVPALCGYGLFYSTCTLQFVHFTLPALRGYGLFCKALIISSYFLLSVASVLVFGTVAILHNKCYLIIR